MSVYIFYFLVEVGLTNFFGFIYIYILLYKFIFGLSILYFICKYLFMGYLMYYF